MTAPALLELGVGDVEPAPYNYRRHLEGIDDLAYSIKEDGLLQPLVVAAVVEQGGATRFVLIAGHRRLAAAAQLGLKVVPCIVHYGLSDVDRAAMTFVENVQRQDLNPVEEASGLRYLKSLGLSQRGLADRIGRPPMFVNERLKLLKLPDDVLDRIESRELSLRDALALTKLADYPKRLKQAMSYDGELPLATVIDRHVKAIGHEKEIAKLVDELERNHMLHVEWPAQGDFSYFDMRPLAGQGHRQSIGMGVVDHEAEISCHAACVDPGAPRIVWVCLDPSRHAPVQQSFAAPPPASDRVEDAEVTVRSPYSHFDVSHAVGTNGVPPESDPAPVVASFDPDEDQPAGEFDPDYSEPVEAGPTAGDQMLDELEDCWQRAAARVAACRTLLLNPVDIDVVRLRGFVDVNSCRPDLTFAAELLELGAAAFADADAVAEALMVQLFDRTARDAVRALYALALSAGESIVRSATTPPYANQTSEETDVAIAYLQHLETADFDASADRDALSDTAAAR